MRIKWVAWACFLVVGYCSINRSETIGPRHIAATRACAEV